MIITVLCTDINHPVWEYLYQWVSDKSFSGHTVALISDVAEIRGGDILFLVSCSQIIRPEQRALYKAALVLHASDLPKGRGWSPHIWAIVAGARNITVSLLEADDRVDSGRIWLKTEFDLAGHELLAEINEKLFSAEIFLMTQAVELFSTISPTDQQGDPDRYLPKRTPADSRLDPNRTIAEQFDLLRVVDSNRYPAFFDFRGHRYLIRIEKAPTSDNNGE